MPICLESGVARETIGGRMIDILFVAHNRLTYVKNTFQALLDNTNWELVNRLYICDDASTDGTAEYLRAWLPNLDNLGIKRRFISTFGGPVAAMNLYLDEAQDGPDADRFAKIDSDFIVCPGWLEESLRQMTIHPGIDAFGLQPRMGPAVAPPCLHRTVDMARFIGGIGLIRHRAFEFCRPRPNGAGGRFGWTEYQTAHSFKKAWVTPDLPCFCLDLLPFEPWISLAQEYIDAGWMRPWAKYDNLGSSYWDWWLK